MPPPEGATGHCLPHAGGGGVLLFLMRRDASGRRNPDGGQSGIDLIMRGRIFAWCGAPAVAVVQFCGISDVARPYSFNIFSERGSFSHLGCSPTSELGCKENIVRRILVELVFKTGDRR